MPSQNIGKQNLSTNRTATSSNKNHPSYQSVGQEYRPAIRVGYTVTKVNNDKPLKHSSRNDKNSLMNGIVTKTCRRMVNPGMSHGQQKSQGGRKRVASSYEFKSGAFVNCEYVKEGKNAEVFHKKNVRESHEKYQSGQAVKNHLQNQFVTKGHSTNSRRSASISSLHSSKNSRQTLPSYQSTGIKDVMQYHHAGNYRETRITQKCTKAPALSRFFKYEQIHDFDFRKKPEFLRT